ncbi:uncharacterized protein Z519_07769 [Cladophialophora bantiana CBS 173.52]|uniref:Uncharacterized protein n=1 Tax=Cladophialophora bantiana (strain ATCC 10958 / CBS 173.52 / CDC B-1940 / NIH 8579) TaxID=1442370 RepID=A0A0D2I4I0_CLAB1|nr:uncharacterized protein Z519_07769 [Cladophialophora bantiana CBS 173.52]KIW91799.1 hypothetical protein Z519_07769 [Cladophialophora bantiana CBS 173.52]
MPPSVPPLSIAPLIVTSTTGTTIQALDNLTGETSGMAAIMAANCSQKTGKGEKTKKRHWWSRIVRKGRPCREMKSLETAPPSRTLSRAPRPLDEDMFPRRIRTNSSHSMPTARIQAGGFIDDKEEMTKSPVEISTAAATTSTSPRSSLTSRGESSPRGSCSSDSSFGASTSPTSTDGVSSRSSIDSRGKVSATGVAALYEALGTRAIMKEQKKLEDYRKRHGMQRDRAVDSLVLGNAFIGM